MTSATADDLGHFRVSGLPPGKYRVYTDIEIAGGMNISKTGGAGSYVYLQGGKGSLAMHLFVYQPGTLRKSKAAILEIKGDEEVQGANLRVELNGLHSVMGRAAPRGSPCEFPLGFAVVIDDGDKSFYRAVDVEPDGNFQINFVPNGTYTLQVNASCFRSPTIHAEAGMEKEKLINFRAAELSVVVMDRDADAGKILLDELVVKP